MASGEGTFKLNHETMAQILETHTAPVDAAVARVKAAAEAEGHNVLVESTVTDRYVGAVHVDAAAQARDGAGTRAAAAAGLTPP